MNAFAFQIPTLLKLEWPCSNLLNSKEGPRAAKPHFADAISLYDYEAMDDMVRETYSIWNEILKERTAEARKRADVGPMFAKK